MRKILLLLSLLFIAVPSAFAQMNQEPMSHCKNCDISKHEMGGMMGMEHKGGMDRMGDMMGMCLENAEKIGLTPDQINKITPVHREMQKKHVRFKADLKIAEIELMEIMEVKDFDLEKASAAVKKMSELKTAHHLDNLKSMKEVRSVMSDDQFKKMKQLMSMKMDKNMKKPVKKMMHKKMKP